MQAKMCWCPYHTDRYGTGTILPLSAFRRKMDGSYSRHYRKGMLLLLWERRRAWEAQRAAVHPRR